MKGIMPYEQFKKFLKIDKLQFQKGKGREFTGTPVGTLFVASEYTDDRPAFVAVAGADVKTKEGVSLEGTLWLCNSTLQLTRER